MSGEKLARQVAHCLFMRVPIASVADSTRWHGPACRYGRRDNRQPVLLTHCLPFAQEEDMSDELPKNRTLTLELDQLDYDAIQKAIAHRQTYRVLPDGDGNLVGRYVAEVCRGFLEMKGVI